MNASDSGKAASTTGPFDEAALARLREWDPAWAEVCAWMATSPWQRGVLPRRLAELVSVAVSAAATNLNADGTRRHIRGALEAGATRDEVLMVLKMASLMTLHSCSLGAPILLEEAKAAGARAQPQAGPTPACDQIMALGQWNTAWDPFLALDPTFTDAFMAAGAGVYATGVLPPKEVELLSIAFDASFTHMYAPGTRRHIHNALAAGATVDEIMAVLELCVVQGVQALNLGVPILAEELRRQSLPAN
jgi:alkylhydroperoxidase/carboxymuconolactone decarboxylase family protein YurZ